MAGKCPKCEATISRGVIAGIPLGGLGMKNLKGVSYSCPMCSTVISIGVDPVALKSDTVQEVVSEIRRRR